jgi:hypothetical protein
VAFDDWLNARPHLAARTENTTARQRNIAACLGVELTDGEPRLVSAAKLRSVLAPELDLPRKYPPSQRQVDFLHSLCGALDVEFPLCETNWEADDRIRRLDSWSTNALLATAG